MFEGRTRQVDTSTERAEIMFPGAADGRTSGATGCAGSAARSGDRGLIRSPAGRTGEDLSVSDLVEGARRGDQAAWNALVGRYLPLVRAVTRSYRLREKDAEDVSQTVWLRLVEHLGRIQEPMALPKWIITVARHESGRLARSAGRAVPIDLLGDTEHDLQADHAEVDADLLRAEQYQALRDALAELPPAQQELLLLLAADPPLSYRDISRVLSIPVGSIGPTRARCLKRLRETSALREFLRFSAVAEPTASRA